jgi:hypothetical protein
MSNEGVSFVCTCHVNIEFVITKAIHPVQHFKVVDVSQLANTIMEGDWYEHWC